MSLNIDIGVNAAYQGHRPIKLFVCTNDTRCPGDTVVVSRRGIVWHLNSDSGYNGWNVCIVHVEKRHRHDFNPRLICAFVHELSFKTASAHGDRRRKVTGNLSHREDRHLITVWCFQLALKHEKQSQTLVVFLAGVHLLSVTKVHAHFKMVTPQTPWLVSDI